MTSHVNNMVQLHGKNFEDTIKAMLFPGSADGGRTSTAIFDVEAKFDKLHGLPSSIKCAKLGKRSTSVGLSDARRFWSFSDAYFLYVSTWQQVGDRKRFASIKRFLIDDLVHQTLIGSLTLPEVTAFHEGLSLTSYRLGQHNEARAFAKQQKSVLQKKCANLILNPKVDSKSQRRLQCSVHLDTLEGITQPLGSKVLSNGVVVPYFFEYIGSVGTQPLPFEIISSPRKFSKKVNGAVASAVSDIAII